MQKFGIEIRRTGDTRNLFADVDLCLKKHNIQPCSVSDQAKVATVAHALNKMIQADRHFSICCIDACMKVCNICISKERYDVYYALHCMNWNEMLPDYRQMIVAMVLDDFRSVLCP